MRISSAGLLVAVRCDRHIGAFYETLMARMRRPIVATVTVMC